MSLAELYLWFKALHIAAALMFVGGVLALTIVLDAIRIAPGTVAIARVRRWDRAVTTPAMLLVWVLGFMLAMTAHWLADHWLQAKLVLVVILSGLHGVQSGRLRRAENQTSGASRSLAPIVLAIAIMIAVLAVLKPWK
ncbi:CopD family protein [Pseudomonas sp. Marseille-Q7302]